LNVILNYTFLPHMWNVYPSFFNLLRVPYRDQESKFGDMIAHRTPLGPRTTTWIWEEKGMGKGREGKEEEKSKGRERKGRGGKDRSAPSNVSDYGLASIIIISSGQTM